MQIEICCGDLMSVLEAKKGGASRIELCSALSEGGITPSIGLIEAAVKAGIPMVNVLIRPRSGDFLYDEAELALMERDIEEAVAHGAHGIVTGALTSEGEVDTAAMDRFIKAARKVNPATKIIFHRAFDLVSNPLESLEQIIASGCDGILTSGQAASALKGVETLKHLTEQNKGRILILAGGGVTPENAAEIIRETGVEAVHSSARELFPSKMNFKRDGVTMGKGDRDEYAVMSTSSRIVKKLIDSIK